MSDVGVAREMIGRFPGRIARTWAWRCINDILQVYIVLLLNLCSFEKTQKFSIICHRIMTQRPSFGEACP